MSNFLAKGYDAAPMTGGEIKVAYESQVDTNAFDDAKNAKLNQMAEPIADVFAFFAGAGEFADGVVLETVKEGFLYEAVPAGGHVGNAGGQRFNVLPNGDGTANVKAFGVYGGGGTLNAVALQAALDSDLDLVFAETSYNLAVPLRVSNSRLRSNLMGKPVNRTQAVIAPAGNHAVFINDDGFVSFDIQGFFIDYGDATPTDFATEGGKVALDFRTRGGGWPEYISIEDVTIRGAWRGYYDDTGTFLSKLTRVACRKTRSGFYKYGGTTINFDTCSSSDGISGFDIRNCVSPVLTNCSADGLAVPAGQAGNYFEQITSLTINGWDGESNVMTGNGASYMQFKTTTGVVNGMSGVLNSLVGATGEEVYFLYSSDNSNMTFGGFRVNRDANWLAYTGAGGSCFTLKAHNNGQCVLIGSDFSAPTGGTPDNRYSVAGTSGAWIDAIGTYLDQSTSQVSFKSHGGVVTIDNQLSIPNGTARFGTTDNIGGGQQNGGFGGEKATFQGNANGPLFSSTAGANSGVSAQFARGNDGHVQYFFHNGSAVGGVSVTASGTTFATSSDYRLKDNVVPLHDALKRVARLNPCRFNFKADQGKTMDGFLAHEVQGVVPEAVLGQKDQVDGFQSLDQSKLVPLLVAAVQELTTRLSEIEPQKVNNG